MTIERLFGIDLPIIQAPMAGSQDSTLAAAVSNAGALGSLPCGLLSAEGLRSEIKALKARTDRPFNVNFFCHRTPAWNAEREAAWRKVLSPYYKEYGLDIHTTLAVPTREPFNADVAEVLEEFKPSVVSFHFGLPSPALLARVKSVGSKILSTATTVDEARWLEAHGVDAVIAQGLEAGGHRGMFLTDDVTTQTGMFALLPQVLRAVSVPVIAAGGIADAHGVAEAIALGAAGVQIGTAYLLCPEATTSQVHRDALGNLVSRHTALTNLFTGRPARSIVNRLIEELGPMSATAPDFPLAASALAPLRVTAERDRCGDFSPLWAGQNTSGCSILRAGELTHRLAADLRLGSRRQGWWHRLTSRRLP